MLYGESRSEHRQIFFDVWEKFNTKTPLTPLEEKILQIILAHPEYHSLLENSEKSIEQTFHAQLSETNPFLHLGLHLTLLEQVQTNQPLGITKLYKQAVESFQDPHEAQHCIMNSLAIAIDDVLRHKKAFDEKAYFKRVKTALKKGYW